MNKRHIKTIVEALDEVIKETEWAVHICEQEGYGELTGQREILSELESAKCAFIQSNT